MSQIKKLSAWQFAAFRIAFGCYLVTHFIGLMPWAGELFSREGLLPDPRLNFTFGLLPNPLEHWQSPAFAQGFLVALTALALCFALGICRRASAVLLWFGWACLFNRNNLISNPGIPYVGLLLLLCALVPPGEPLRLGRSRTEHWQMPAALFHGAWWLLAAGYTYSGAWKLCSPSWLDGSALHHLLTNPLARPGWMRDALLVLPDQVLHVLTWAALAGELLALPLSVSQRGRAVAWLWMLAMHLGILLVVDFADLTFGMVMIHLFTFDPEWLPARRGRRVLVLFDGDCGLCDRTVQFLRGEDAHGELSFAPLQGATAAPILKRHGLDTQPLRSLVLVEHPGEPAEQIYLRSSAVLCALDTLGGFWRVVSWLCVMPPSVRDAAYAWVAARRHQWFGPPAQCSLSSGGT